MKTFMMLVAILLPNLAMAVPILSFDDGANPQDGIVTYDGAGGSLVGTGIDFYDIIGNDTPLNSGVALECRGCELSFTTGLNIVEGVINRFDSGGLLTLIGEVYDGVTLVASGVLASGSFTNNPVANVVGTSGLFLAIGVDTKNQDLLDFYGLNNPFKFASTQIALGSCTAIGDPGGVQCNVQNADFENVAVPIPGTLGLLGIGALGLVARRRR